MQTTHPASGARFEAAQTRLVRDSFALVAPVAAQAAALFYGRLFEREPAVARLFGGDMKLQGERLMTMIASAVAGLDRPDMLSHTLVELGRRHQGYGVQQSHYDAVGAALIDTLAGALGEALTPAHRAAWAAVYQHIAALMQQGQAAAAASAAGADAATA